MRSLGIASVVALALATLAVGCGGDSNSGSTTISTSELAKAQYLKRATALCTKSTEERFAAVEKVAREREAAASSIEKQDLEEFAVTIMLPAISALREELAELGAPKGDAKTIEGLLEQLDKSVAIGEEEPQKFVDGGLFDSVNQAFANYGLEGCRM